MGHFDNDRAIQTSKAGVSAIGHGHSLSMYLVVFNAQLGWLLRNVGAIQLAEKVRYTLEAVQLRRAPLR